MLHDPVLHRHVAPNSSLNQIGISEPATPAAQRAQYGRGSEPAEKSSHIPSTVMIGTLRIAEAAAIVAVGAAIHGLYISDYALDSQLYYLPTILAVALAMSAVSQIGGLYTLHSLLRPAEALARLAFGWTMVFAAVFALVFFAQQGVALSRIWIASWFLGGFVSLVLLRIWIARLVRRWNADGRLARRGVIVGGGKTAEDLIRALEGSTANDVSIIGIFDDRKDERSPESVAGYPRLGTPEELVTFARSTRVDLLIVTLPLTAEQRLLEILRKLWVLPVDVRLSAYTQKLRYRPRAYSYIGNVPFLDAFDKPLDGWDVIVKAVEDRVIATLAILLLAPLFAAVALAIRLDSRGPVLFRQRRYGFNNELIEVYKFRSMFFDKADTDARRLVTKDDPRVTRVGRFIRKTSLDELPQLFNVLRGELSLVGPRPHATQAKARDRLYRDVVEGYYARHKVKPGITGWAQINGWRGETDTEEKIERRVEHDLFYIENWSLLFDLAILARTPLALLKGENAY